MRIAIVSVGDELLSGDTVDTNSAWLGQTFSGVGFTVLRVIVVPDDVVAISDAIRTATAGADAVLVQGGLGPTSDDLSREGIAAASGVPLHRDADIEKRLRAWYAERNRPVLDVSLRMADVPDGAEVLPNPPGQAPGLRTVLDGCLIYAVPGVPREMQAIVTESVLPDLIARATARPDVLTQTLRIAVRGESEVATLVAAGGPTPPGLRVAYLARPGDVRLRVTGPAEIEEPYAQQLRTLLGELVYGEGDDTLDVVIHRLLAAQRATLAVAESLTGGQLGETLTRMAGSSATFVGGVVAYETRLKTMLLGVDGDVLNREGAVHPDVARQMAEGVRQRLGSTYGLSTTGVAGPEPADGHDPGTVYVAAAGPAGTQVRSLRLGGGRDLVRELAVVHALNLLYGILRAGNNG
ncbi:MAG TPA: CinA family nicotinamide mononucleotide deamidase-related protein [Actinomycetes bacterium]|nr:CinA family nicotinamide mononucleotide deamidase-related protein [Actinomycetes bacterium]